MAINEFQASHTIDVNVGFILSGPRVDPHRVSDLIKILPDRSARKGDERRNIKGDLLGYEDNGWWRLDSGPRLNVTGIRSKDINEHLKILLKILMPHCELLNLLSEGGETFFDVLWKSSYLYAGTGPLIEAEHLRGMVDLRAGLGFDIYQVDEEN
jgi:hypothetical protein